VRSAIMRFRHFSYRRSALLGCVLVACVAVLASPGSALDGKAQWDPAVLQLYFKYVDNIDIGPGPGDYPHREMLTKINAEFAKRVDTLMAVYRAAGGKDVGIVPGTGALRTAVDQIKIWTLPPTSGRGYASFGSCHVGV